MIDSITNLSKEMQLALIFSFSFCLLIECAFLYNKWGKYAIKISADSKLNQFKFFYYVLLDAMVFPFTFWIILELGKLSILEAYGALFILTLVYSVFNMIKFEQFSFQAFLVDLIYIAASGTGTYLIFSKYLGNTY